MESSRIPDYTSNTWESWPVAGSGGQASSMQKLLHWQLTLRRFALIKGQQPLSWGQQKWGLQEVASSLTESSSFFCSKVGGEREASCRTMASGWREPKFHMCPEPPVPRSYKESCQIHSSRPSSSLKSRDFKEKVFLHDRRQSPVELGWHLKAK